MTKMDSRYINKKSNSKKHFTILGFALLWLVLDAEWLEWFFRETIFSSSIVVYFSFSLLLFLFLMVLGKNTASVRNYNWIWIPYMVVTFLGYLFQLKFQKSIYWLVYLIIILISFKSNILKAAPLKIIFFSGLFAMIGVYVQFFFLPFWSAYIDVLFTYEDKLDVIELGDAYGMNGFTYQQGTTSIILMYGLIVWLYLKDEVLPDLRVLKISHLLLALLMIIAVFLTGKRMMSLVVFFVPLLVYFFSKNRGSKRFITAGVICLLLFIVYKTILPDLLATSDIFFFKRMAVTLDAAKSGESVDALTTGRQYLGELAIKAWQDSPIFGIGIGLYQEYTHAYSEAHNTYLQILCEQGLVGFCLYITAILYYLLLTLRLMNSTKCTLHKQYLKASLAMQLVYILYGLSGNVNIGLCPPLYVLGVAVAIRVSYLEKSLRNEITAYTR